MAPLFYFHSMLQLNSLASPSETLYVHIPADVKLQNLNLYPMRLVKVATGVQTGTTDYIAGATNRRTTEVRFATYQLDLGMYTAEFSDDRGNVIYSCLCYASPGGDTAIPQTNYEVAEQNSESIYIYYDE